MKILYRSCCCSFALPHLRWPFLQLPSQPRRDRRAKITDRYEARKTQLAGRKPPTLNQPSVTPLSSLPLRSGNILTFRADVTDRVHVISTCAFLCLCLTSPLGECVGESGGGTNSHLPLQDECSEEEEERISLMISQVWGIARTGG